MITRGEEIRVEIPATLGEMARVADQFRARTAAYCDPKPAFMCELLLREALTNAVLHGSQRGARYLDNGQLPVDGAPPEPGTNGKGVRCVVRLKASRILIWVEDEGPGFDWRTQMDRASDPSVPGGRGMEIYKKYATRVRFNRKGNGVALLVRF